MNPRALRVNKQQKNFFGFTCPLNPSGRLVSDFFILDPGGRFFVRNFGHQWLIFDFGH